MLHTKFRENRPAGSGEEDFEGFYHIWAWRPPRCREQNIVPPTQGGSTLNLALIGPAVSEKKMFEIVYGDNDDDDGGRTTDAGSMGIL